VTSAAITLCVAYQRVFVVVYFVIDSVLELLDTASYSWLDTYLSAGRISPFFALRDISSGKGKGKGKVVPLLH
jgi:hypothetical protein